MPWECKTVEKIRREFVAKAVMGEQSISELCRQYNISRPTAYKWIDRYKTGKGFADRPHTPFSSPRKTAKSKEDLVLAVRERHQTWGPRKIHQYLLDKGHTDLPAVSTIAAILKRNDKIAPEATEQHTPWKRFEMKSPNMLWQMDYKGHFGMMNGNRCHPLTILDDCSRFSLCVDAKGNEQWLPTRHSLVHVFREYGLPEAILCDNGKPWGDTMNGYTPFEIWMMQMDVLPIHGRIMHPQTQGKDERFHRTLKEDLLDMTPIHDLQHAQKEFDSFRYCYNFERPHGALDLKVPARLYKPSKKLYIEAPCEPEYDSGKQLRKVNAKGYVSLHRHRYYLSESFVGKYLEIANETETLINLCYGNFVVAKIDLEERVFASRKIFRR